MRELALIAPLTVETLKLPLSPYLLPRLVNEQPMNTLTTPTTQDLLTHTLAFCDECLNRQEFAKAWQALCRAVALAPNRADVLSHRGRLALFLKDTQTAQRDFAEALKNDPRCSAALSGLARYHWLRGELAEAEAAADSALGIDAADEEAGQVKAEIEAKRLKSRQDGLSKTNSRSASQLVAPTKPLPAPGNEGCCDAVSRACLVKSNGDVYPCCFSAQWDFMKLGNLREMEFEELWRSRRAEELRECSRRGKMPCPSCLVPRWRNIQPRNPVGNPVPGKQTCGLADIVMMQIEPSTFCNGRCYMCVLDVTDKTEIDYPKIIRAMQQMSLRSVNLVGGEVFFAPRIDPFLAWLYETDQKTKRLGLSMTSNGAIPESRIAELVSYYTSFDVTFLGTTPEIEKAVSGLNYERKLAFMKRLVKARHEHDYQGRPRLRLGISLTIVPTNFHQIPDAITLAGELGVDFLNYNYDGIVVQFIHSFPKIANQVREGLRQKLQQPQPFHIVTEPLKGLQLLTAPARGAE